MCFMCSAKRAGLFSDTGNVLAVFKQRLDQGSALSCTVMTGRPPAMPSYTRPVYILPKEGKFVCTLLLPCCPGTRKTPAAGFCAMPGDTARTKEDQSRPWKSSPPRDSAILEKIWQIGKIVGRRIIVYKGFHFGQLRPPSSFAIRCAPEYGFELQSV